MRPDVALYNGIASDGTLQCYTTTRVHESFAKSPEVDEVCKVHDRYARARNARLVMSNIIPDTASQAVIPYCIWYPDVATKDTYRELFYRHPEMRYHIGRACAVAGYRQLYNELDLLPDVSIAEEARDNDALDIFEHIICRIHDQELVSMETPLCDLLCNAIGHREKTEVPPRRNLLAYTSAGQPYGWNEVSIMVYYCCVWRWKEEVVGRAHDSSEVEDSSISTYTWSGPGLSKLQGEHIDLLHDPLPRGLPPINKDILFLMAAWDGNIDRYARLRRPVTVPNEMTAVVTLAYIAGDHEDIFLELSDGTRPTQEQWEAALQSRRKFYMENIERRAREEDLEFCDRYDWIQEYQRPTKEFYRGYDELEVIKEISNEPDDNSEDWDDWYQAEDNLLNYHMHLQMVKWQKFITATDKARQGVPSTSKAYGGLYSTMEDQGRRLEPPPQPKLPKSCPLAHEFGE
ncbi:hypothetical protein CSAL01_08371 [Colletotrichum salicis]|uniref:Uncharacterized protein n=1 Tax=Colletotrichum salicis TaxID=1209931 RepID=A0A135V944_9PEZI|nr:hypothetical protein CSAL01_08371 [Colletotrichum salicis]